jgi:hypothetical protein
MVFNDEFNKFITMSRDEQKTHLHKTMGVPYGTEYINIKDILQYAKEHKLQFQAAVRAYYANGGK